MTISTLVRKNILQGTGIQTVFNFTFQVRFASDIQVFFADALGNQTLLQPNQYAVALNPVPGGQLWAQGGSVTYPLVGAPIAAGQSLTIARTVPITQGTSLINVGGYSPQSTEQALDLLTMAMQQINETLARSLVLPITSTASTALPPPVANAVLQWNGQANAIVNGLALPGVVGLPLAPGIATYQGGNTFASVVITAGVGMTITNGDGQAGAPVIAFSLVTTKGDLVTFSNTPVRLPAGADGNHLVPSSAAASGLAWAGPGMALWNGELVASQNGTVLTIAVKTHAGNDPSDADPVYVYFRDPTAKLGDVTTIKLNAATSIATVVGGTFGVANAVPFSLWIVGFNDGGTFRLALINCLTTAAGVGAGRDVTAIYPLAQVGLASSTQIGAGSTSAGVFYSAGAAVASKAYTTLGRIIYEAGLAAAGTFNVDQSTLDLYRAGNPLPGQVIQIARTPTGAVATGTTTVANNDNIPQNTAGDQYTSQALVRTSGANVLLVESSLVITNSAAGANNLLHMVFQDATANALYCSWSGDTVPNIPAKSTVTFAILAGGTGSTTFKARAGSDAAGTTTLNGQTAARKYGGTLNSYMDVREIVG